MSKRNTALIKRLLTIALLMAIPLRAQHLYGNVSKKLSNEVYGSSAYADIKNLQDLASAYFNGVCRENGRSDGCYKYVDIDGKQDSNYPYRRVDVIDTSNLVYSVLQQIQKPSLVLSQDYCNSLDEAGSFEFHKTTTTTSQFTWSVTQGLTSTNEISVKVGVPELLETQYSESIQLSFS